MGFGFYVIKRTAIMIPTLIVIMSSVFFLIHLAPGDPLYIIIGESTGVSPEYLEMMREKYGLDKPLYMQFFIYISLLMQGSLGYSFVQKMPVFDLIVSRMPATIILMTLGFSSAILISLVIGVYSTIHKNTIVDYLCSSVTLSGFSIPTFWLGIMLILLFSITLDLFPTGGMMTVGKDLSSFNRMLDILWHAILPTLTVAAYQVALFLRLIKSKLSEVLMEDYIVTAHSKGLPYRTVVYRHALRNAVLPLITMIGYNVGIMFTGVILAETVFSWPGVGRLLYDSMLSLDYPTVLGIFVVSSIIILLATFVTDLIYFLIDPRIREEVKR